MTQPAHCPAGEVWDALIPEYAGLLDAGAEEGRDNSLADDAPGPLLQDAAALLYWANKLVLAVAARRLMSDEWTDSALDWNSQFAGWAGRHARGE